MLTNDCFWVAEAFAADTPPHALDAASVADSLPLEVADEGVGAAGAAPAWDAGPAVVKEGAEVDAGAATTAAAAAALTAFIPPCFLVASSAWMSSKLLPEAGWAVG
jgi:hypothetical protein